MTGRKTNNRGNLGRKALPEVPSPIFAPSCNSDRMPHQAETSVPLGIVVPCAADHRPTALCPTKVQVEFPRTDTHDRSFATHSPRYSLLSRGVSRCVAFHWFEPGLPF